MPCHRGLVVVQVETQHSRRETSSKRGIEMKKILEQCTNSKSAYYKPISLHIKKIASDEVREKGHSSEKRSGDLLITLKGKFVARRE